MCFTRILCKERYILQNFQRALEVSINLAKQDKKKCSYINDDKYISPPTDIKGANWCIPYPRKSLDDSNTRQYCSNDNPPTISSVNKAKFKSNSHGK